MAATPRPIRSACEIGINVGDIIIEGEDIYGDGVNIAARLEGIAEPGGICLSRAVHEQVAGKVEAVFTELGVRNLKNIDTPIQVFQVGERVEGSQTFTLPPLISDRPSIAVLPFNSLSENRNIELLADGLVEDVIALLARVPAFSSFLAHRVSLTATRRRTFATWVVNSASSMSSKAASVLRTNVPEFRLSSSKPKMENKFGHNDLMWS
jgi:adenylate cyclase